MKKHLVIFGMLAGVLWAGCALNQPVSLVSGNAYAVGQISASGSPVITTNGLFIYFRSTKQEISNAVYTGEWPECMFSCTNLPVHYYTGVTPGSYYIYAWLDLNRDGTNNTGDLEGWYGSPSLATLEEKKTNTFNIVLSSK
jgi:hypothetical protein